ncbi:MAG TPA: DUF2339 domain-containing protein, partial [Thermoanaerobaculia bacterium]
GTAAFVVVVGVAVLAVSAFLRSKEAKKTADALRAEVDRLRGLVVRLERRVHDLEARPGAAITEIKPAAVSEIKPTSSTEMMTLTFPPESARRVETVVLEPAAPEPVHPPALPPPVLAPPPAPRVTPRIAPPPPLPPQPPAQSLEEKLGARLPVWIGSIALALAGAFLVKLSFDRGWLSPAFRVSLGVLFGVGLLAAGEVTRRSRSTRGISQGLSAAGVADLFACFLAGIHMYGIIPPPLGFGLMVLTTAVAVGLSLRQGRMVALIGLIGGFLTPYLVRTGEPNLRGLFAYLLLLQVGLLVVAWRRGWTEIGGLALGGGLLWAFAWLAGPFKPADAAFLSGFLLLSVAAVVAAGLAGRRSIEDSGGGKGMLSLTWAAVPGAILALGAVSAQAGFSTEEWVFFGILAAGVLVLGRLRPDLSPLAWVAAVAGAVLMIAFAAQVHGEPDLSRFLATAAGAGTLFAVGGYIALWGSEKAGRWASLSAASGIVFFLIAWGTMAENREGLHYVHWGPEALGAALLYLLAAVPVAQRRRADRPDHPAMTAALAALAVAVTVFVSLAVPLELERQWVTVAWALEVTALVWLAGRFKLPALSALARTAAVLVAIRLLLNASVFEYPLGTSPVFNWLLYGYGVPLLAFAAAAWLARRQGPGETKFATLLESGALAFAFALVTLEVRQLYHPGTPASGVASLAESGAMISAWAAFAIGLLAANRKALLSSVERAGRLLLALAAGAALVFLGAMLNPLWDHGAVGETPVFNLLLWSYGLPAVLLGLATPELRRRGSRKLPAALTTTVLILVFLLLTLEIRQAFHGTYLNTGTSSIAERYSYSAAWILFGAALLVLGILRKVKALRYASLAVMLLSVGKVFLYDMSNLTDLYRVFSFLGLGMSLLALAWVYQRFVFRESS